MANNNIWEGIMSHRAGSFRWLFGLLALAAALVPGVRQARAQEPYVACPPVIDLTETRLPEIVSNGGRLRGTVVLADGQRTQVLAPGNPNQDPETPCRPRWGRPCAAVWGILWS
jgi:hypothetical protein